VGGTVFGDGNQVAAVERLRSELEERGWFDDEQKQRSPALPEQVGVVTSLRDDARYSVQGAINEQDSTIESTSWWKIRPFRSEEPTSIATDQRDRVEQCSRSSAASSFSRAESIFERTASSVTSRIRAY
jgi:hypothetical protein